MKRILIACISSLVVIFSSSLGLTNNDRWLNKLDSETFGEMQVKPHYKIGTQFLDWIAIGQMKEAMDLWNKASGYDDFLVMAQPGETPDIVVTSFGLEPYLWGIAVPYKNIVCTVTVAPKKAYIASLYMHELGHCLGLAHAKKPGTVMYSGVNSTPPVPEVDNGTKRDLHRRIKWARKHRDLFTPACVD